MINNDEFFSDLAKAKPSERIVRMALEDALSDKGMEFKDVADEKICRYKGDIEVVCNGKSSFIDVKDDGVWHKTGNLLAEDQLSYYGGPRTSGFMRHAKYNLVAYHSKKLQKILLIDFKGWQKVYKKPSYGYRKTIKHPTQTTYGYLNPIQKLKDEGIVCFEIDYDYSGKYENPSHVECISIKRYGKYAKAS